MQSLPLPSNESERLADLLEYDILDTGSEEEFENIIRLAAAICETEIAAITFVDSDRQWLKARFGISIPETRREHSFCTYTILQEELFIVKDALEREEFRNFWYVKGEPGVRFYAGAPIASQHGHRIGTLSVMDRQTRNLDEHQRQTLQVLSQQISLLLEKRRIATRLNNAMQIQSRLLESLIKDVKGPLAATGTFLQLLERGDRDWVTNDGLLVIATRQFYQSLTKLNSLVEWGRLHQLERSRRWPVTDSRTLIAEVLEHARREAHTRSFTLADLHGNVISRNLPDWEIHFVLKLVVFWFCELAQDGVITVERVFFAAEKLKVELRLHSSAFFPNWHWKIEKLAAMRSWPSGVNSPTSGLYVMMVKDILEDFDGNIRLATGPDKVEAIVEVDLRRGQKRG
jgi:hypothetical protein